MEFNHLFEVFFLSAILTILGIRIYLALTGYPQLGAGEIHVAHMLWGGIFMVLSIFGFMTFLNDDLKPFWAFLGGIGFGTFIDEIGKFITNDNNYFYQPTFALIYITFIILYLIYKSFEKHQTFTSDEYLINSLDKFKDAIIHNLDKEEKELAISYLKKANRKDQLTLFLRKEFSKLKNIPQERKGAYTSIKNMLSGIYFYFIKKPFFLKIIVATFIIRSLGYLIALIIILATTFYALFLDVNPHLPAPWNNPTQAIPFFALLVQGVFVIAGVAIIWKSRLIAYRFFRNASFVSIFVLQVFNYYQDPLNALFATIVDLLILNILNYMISQELLLQKTKVN